jgi:hypothetical protein
MISQDQLLNILGDPYTNQVTARLRRLAHIPEQLLRSLAEQALNEEWGNDNYVLLKYLAVHVSWSIEQNRFTSNQAQFYVTAGNLHTRYGTPIYLVFEENRVLGRQPYCLVHVSSEINAPSLPTPPEIPVPLSLPCGVEIVLSHDHILGNNADRVPFLSQTPHVAQMCAVAGAIQWSLNRNLQMAYWYFGHMQYLVPLYLQSRENITLAPDLIAPIQVNPDCFLVRTILLPYMPYSNARVAVRRHDQLPHWMLDGWKEFAAQATTDQIDNPESEQD